MTTREVLGVLFSAPTPQSSLTVNLLHHRSLSQGDAKCVEIRVVPGRFEGRLTSGV